MKFILLLLCSRYKTLKNSERNYEIGANKTKNNFKNLIFINQINNYNQTKKVAII